MTKEIDFLSFDQQARRIRVQVSGILARWGLLPRFKRWRLAQDQETGMVVLFGVLNENYIASRTSIPFSNYFDPRLLHELANELKVQVVSCNSETLRYAFILDRGSLGKLPTHIDYPFVDDGRLMVRVVFGNVQQPMPVPPIIEDDDRFMRQIAGAFLKVFEDIKIRDDAALLLSAQDPPDIAIIDEVEFNKRVIEHEVNRLKVQHIKEFFDAAEKK